MMREFFSFLSSAGDGSGVGWAESACQGRGGLVGYASYVRRV